MMGIYPLMRSNIENRRHFPDHQDAVVDSAHSTSGPSSSGSTPLSTPIGSPPGLNPNAAEFLPFGARRNEDKTILPVRTEVEPSASLSFAQMLQSGKSKTPVRLAVSKLEGSAVNRVKNRDSEDSDSEDRVPVPVFQESFGSAIQKALDSLATNPGEEVVIEEAAPSTGKKKKKVKKLLFTTSMNRSK